MDNYCKLKSCLKGNLFFKSFDMHVDFHDISSWRAGQGEERQQGQEGQEGEKGQGKEEG